MSLRRFFSTVFQASARSDWVSSNDHWAMRAGAMRTDTGLYVSETMALNLPVVYACVGLLSDVLATAPAQVVEVSEAPDGTRRTKPVIGDPRESMLNLRPNEYMTAFTARQTLQAHTLLWGNGYGQIFRNSRGQAEELYPLPAGSIAPVTVDTARGKSVRWRGTVDGQSFDKPSDEIFRIQTLGNDGYSGLSPIALSRQALGLGLAMEKYGAKLFANDLRSGGFVSHPAELSPQAVKNLEDSLNAKAGLDNAHGVKVLEEGMTFTPGSIPPDDAQFLGSREFTIAEFARMYRVPLELLQAQGKTSSWGSGIEQLFLAFISFTLRPWVKQWEQEMTYKMLTTEEIGRGLEINFNIEDMKRGDSSARAAFYERMVGIKAMTPNEVRADEGRNPLDGGDDFPEVQPSAMPGKTPERIREDDVTRKDEAA